MLSVFGMSLHPSLYSLPPFPSPSTTLPFTFHHSDAKNATLGSHSSHLGCPLHPLPPRHKEHDPRVVFFASGVSLILPLTFYHPDMKNMTPGSRSSYLECPSTLPFTFYHSDTKNGTLGSRSSCLGCPSTLCFTFYHPNMRNATTCSHSSCMGCFLIPPLSP